MDHKCSFSLLSLSWMSKQVIKRQTGKQYCEVVESRVHTKMSQASSPEENRKTGELIAADAASWKESSPDGIDLVLNETTESSQARSEHQSKKQGDLSLLKRKLVLIVAANGTKQVSCPTIITEFQFSKNHIKSEKDDATQFPCLI